jgi:hypothetical protein
METAAPIAIVPAEDDDFNAQVAADRAVASSPWAITEGRSIERGPTRPSLAIQSVCQKVVVGQNFVQRGSQSELLLVVAAERKQRSRFGAPQRPE